MQAATSNYQIFIDETGDPDLDSPKPYILSGCSVEDFRREELANYADHIKFKYWGRTDIVFHSKEIGYNEGPFAKLTDKATREAFEKDLLEFLKTAQYKLFFVVLDKAKAKAEGWDTTKALYKTTSAIFSNFILSLAATNGTGNIYIEPSKFERDSVYLQAFNYFRGPNSKLKEEYGIDYKDVQTLLTSLAFVTKKNFDIEVQIADLMAYGAWQTVKTNKSKMGKYETALSKILKQKLFKLIKRRGGNSKLYKDINPLVQLP